MQSDSFDDLTQSARQVAKLLAVLFEDVTGEDLELGSALKHAPLVTLGLVAGAGLAAGWWFGRRSVPQLPPPITEPEHTPNPLEYVEQMLPEGIKKLRDAIPTEVTQEATALARTWIDSVLEPKIKGSLDTMATNVGESRFGSFLRDTLAGLNESEDRQLDDPPEPPKA